MTIEIKEDTFVHTVFFSGREGCDWLGVIYQHKGEPWEAKYRFRYHEDDKVHESEDEKSWYSLKLQDVEEGPERIIETIRSSVEEILLQTGFDSFEEISVMGGGEKLQEALARCSWSSSKAS